MKYTVEIEIPDELAKKQMKRFIDDAFSKEVFDLSSTYAYMMKLGVNIFEFEFYQNVVRFLNQKPFEDLEPELVEKLQYFFYGLIGETPPIQRGQKRKEKEMVTNKVYHEDEFV